MNENYNDELRQEIGFLFGELAYLRREIEAARNSGNTDKYTKVMRSCLAVEKQYLKLCAEQEKRGETEIDELAAFNGAAV